MLGREHTDGKSILRITKKKESLDGGKEQHTLEKQYPGLCCFWVVVHMLIMLQRD